MKQRQVNGKGNNERKGPGEPLVDQSDRRYPTASEWGMPPMEHRNVPWTTKQKSFVGHSVTTSQIVVAASSGVSDPQFVNERSKEIGRLLRKLEIEEVADGVRKGKYDVEAVKESLKHDNLIREPAVWVLRDLGEVGPILLLLKEAGRDRPGRFNRRIVEDNLSALVKNIIPASDENKVKLIIGNLVKLLRSNEIFELAINNVQLYNEVFGKIQELMKSCEERLQKLGETSETETG